MVCLCEGFFPQIKKKEVKVPRKRDQKVEDLSSF